MTFARLLLEIRRRAAALHDEGSRRESIEQIAREVLAQIPESEQAAQVRRILAAFLGLDEGDRFDGSLLDDMSPKFVSAIDMIAARLLEPDCAHVAVHTAIAVVTSLHRRYLARIIIAVGIGVETAPSRYR